ncbi:unnamed protein product [Tetraodon nigroviridis]|uniref:(spotted green pufferfish) hypothetical protein n=1 Tax=Tetraodon nigroviridis TaxID=99883 RepID=Q4RZY7_TETNG|nr:unnamed protein product [Tetraodon nigroviridis]
MATSGYPEDLQSQQANAVTIATPAATAPSPAKAAHFLSEIPPASTSIAAPNPSKAGQEALCSQTGGQSQKPAALTGAPQHYGSSDIQQSAAQKSNGQSSSPQYIIVTVTGERSVERHTRSRSRECVFTAFFSVTTPSGCTKTRPFTTVKCVTGGNGNNAGVCVCVCVYFWSIYLEIFLPAGVKSHRALSPRASRSGNQTL